MYDLVLFENEARAIIRCMPKIENHAPGTFCWIELATRDQANAKEFYSNLFNWVSFDSPLGPDDYYTTFKLDGAEAAAAYTMRPPERFDTSPHWNLYVAVANADERARRAGELGGKVVVAPLDVMTLGRMAVIQDPTGAVFCIWQGRDHSGIKISHENGTFCWADLSTPAPDRASVFYRELFGWRIGPLEKYPPDYLVIQSGHQPIAGIQPVARRNPEIPPHWMVFFLISDIEALASKVKELGGAVHVPPSNVGGAHFSVVADPQGAAFAVIRPPA